MSTRLGVKLVPSRIWTELAWKGSTSEKIHHQKTTASRRPNRGQISHNVTTAHRQNETQRLENNCTLLHHRTENRKRKIANHKLQKLQTTTTIRDIFCRTPNFFFFFGLTRVDQTTSFCCCPALESFPSSKAHQHSEKTPLPWTTFQQWLRQRPFSPRDILEAFPHFPPSDREGRREKLGWKKLRKALALGESSRL